MKRKDLTAYIREEIVKTLSEGGTINIVATSGNEEEQSIQADPKIKQKPDVIKALKNAAPGQVVRASTNEADLDELALEGSGARYTAGSKFEEAKEIYTTGLFAELLKAIEEAGEKGLTQKELGSILNRGDGSSLNLILKNLRGIGVLVNSKLAAKAAKASQPEEEPEDTEDMDIEDTDMEDVDIEDTDMEDEEEPEEEEDKEDEPVATTKASDDLGKWADELAKLNAKKDDLLKKLKSKEITMDQYKEMIGTIPTQIKVLQAKIDQYSE